jgi:tol-pal system-associated acyl-CoA thioesterase
MSAEFSLPIRVYIEDTDAGGIVYYVNYLKYFERARTEFMRAIGFDKGAFFGDELMFVVTSVETQFHRSARLDDAVSVTAQVVDVGAATMSFVQRVLRDGDLLASATVGVAAVHRETGRPRRLPSVLRDALLSAKI